MSFLKSAIVLGAILALVPGLGAQSHGTGQHDAAATAEGTASPATADTEIVVTVDPGGATAEVVRVTRGAHVHLTVHGAGANELHLHGYDIEVMGEAGRPAFLVFDATDTGRFPLVMHVEDDLLGKSEKAVLYIEVRDP